MKLLLDENLPPRLARSVQDLFPGSAHVEDCGLGTATDAEIWRFALANDFVIVSKDSDFCDRSALYGGPPKVVWLRVGNCSADKVEALLRRSAERISELANSLETMLIVLSQRAGR
jgi:predicted nuclease of predicted toxin-antitoxin system